MSRWAKFSAASIIISSSLIASCSSYDLSFNSLDNSHSYSKAKHHVGLISPEQLLASYPIFKDNKDSDPFRFDAQQISQLAAELDGKTVLVVFGTWCHDSQREVPRLLNLLQSVDASPKQPEYSLKLVAINKQKNNSDYISAFNIKRVPTILVLDKQEQEVRRITERPRDNLAIDLAMN